MPAIGDYARSNGNVASVVNAAHGVRDGIYEKNIASATPVDEPYDLVIIGGGFSGIIAAYEFHKAQPNRRCLILDNHPVFGGEAKQNQMNVDGVVLTGPPRVQRHNRPSCWNQLRACRRALGRRGPAALL